MNVSTPHIYQQVVWREPTQDISLLNANSNNGIITNNSSSQHTSIVAVHPQTMEDVLLRSRGVFYCENTEDRDITAFAKTNDNSAYLMSVIRRGRMGNWMFKYAALSGISLLTNHTPVLHPKFAKLKEIFPNLTIPIVSEIPRLTLLREDNCNVTNSILCLSKYSQHRDVDLSGSFEKHIYFSQIKDEIRADFTFNYSIQKRVDHFFTVHIADYDPEVTITVGIHFRLGDNFHNPRHENSSIMTAQYFINAMEYFATTYGIEILYFVLLSDEQSWVTNNIMPLVQEYKGHVIQSLDNSGSVDLAILAACSHTVISVGTFSWWGAWLSKGNTVYYAGLPRPGYEAVIHPGTVYIPPPKDAYNHWIAIWD
jgi:galactoside 2-L-fucosyltransferase 1/2